ncbi:MAG: hypothetical protein MUP13_07980 [Thermoanaerobaculales bacterium]|nr:hypothetical protein [Thermoanaerobaculales bacterium]
MTAQVPDTVRINGTNYDLCGVRGEGLFDPKFHGIETSAPNSACWRGCICGYAISNDHLVLDTLQLWSEPDRWRSNRQILDRFFGDYLALDDEQPWINAKGLALLVPFTGGLLLGADFIEELYVQMGFHPAYKYQHVLELTFETGQLLSQSDRSIEMEEIRLREGRGDGKRSKDVVAWINDCFRTDY